MRLTIAALVFAALAAGCTGRDVRGPFRNQYIDAETGKPIEGVVFLAVWESVTPTLTGDGGRSFYEAREAVSGPDGMVEIVGLTSPVLRPGLNVRFHAFAAGYDYAPDATRITPPNGKPYVDPTVTAMSRLRTREEQCRSANRPLIPSAPDEKMPRYTSVVHRERDELKCGLK